MTMRPSPCRSCGTPGGSHLTHICHQRAYGSSTTASLGIAYNTTSDINLRDFTTRTARLLVHLGCTRHLRGTRHGRFLLATAASIELIYGA